MDEENVKSAVDVKEKSAIDVIYDIFLEIKELRKEVKVLDNNVKLLNNKLTKNNKLSEEKLQPPRAEVPVKKLPTVDNIVPVQADNVKVFGRIKNHNKEPIANVDIKIYNEKGEIIKKRNTDDKGYWEARISPGKYGIEYDPSSLNKKFKPLNININIIDGMKEYEVK
jgi:hypothetical protein